MITRVVAKNLRSLVDVSIELKGINVLIGPNGGGKSNFIDLFGLLANGATGFLSQGVHGRGGIRSLRSARQNGDSIEIGLEIGALGESSAPGWQYGFELSQFGYEAVVKEEWLTAVGQQSVLFGGDRAAANRLVRRQDTALLYNGQTHEFDAPIMLKDKAELAIAQVRQPNLYLDASLTALSLSLIQVYDPIYPGRYSPHRLPRVHSSESVLFRDASNLATVLSTRLANDEFQVDFDHYARLAFPAYRRIHSQPDPSGEGKILLTWHSEELNRPLYLWELSDGMFKYICLLTILLRPQQGSIICVDEPEVGLHPRLISIIADLIRAAADTAQIVVTTHSPSLVSLFTPDDVVIVESTSGQTTFRRLDQQGLARWLEEFSLGELMAMGKLEERP